MQKCTAKGEAAETSIRKKKEKKDRVFRVELTSRVSSIMRLLTTVNFCCHV